MSRTLIAIGLMSLTGALSAAGAIAGETLDPHARAREMIAPTVTYAPAPHGAMGRLIGADAYFDSHARARNLILADWPVLPAQGAAGVRVTNSHSDTHDRARHFIAGEHD